MSSSIRVGIFNHNTSAFAELALRSLRATCALDLSVCVVDNHSTDTPDLDALVDATRELDCEFELSRFPAGSVHAAGGSHGDVIRDFVLASSVFEHLLLVASDVCFLEQGTVEELREVLLAKPNVWAVQPQQTMDGVSSFATESRRDRWGSAELIGVYRNFPTKLQHTQGTILPSADPTCLLMRNSPLVRQIAQRLGFGAMWLWSEDPDVAGFGDVMALATEIMTITGSSLAQSERMVLHFVRGVQKARASTADELCRRLLTALRNGDETDVLSSVLDRQRSDGG